MLEKFNINIKMDSTILERRIEDWNITHEYSPIIMMSKDTFRDLVLRESVYGKNYGLEYIGGFEYICKICGCKVFIDPEKAYGEVELR